MAKLTKQQLIDLPTSQYKNDLSKLLGWRVGDLFITGRWVRRWKHKAILWEVQCACGSPAYYLNPSAILSGRYRSCKKCSRRKTIKRGSESPYWRGTKDIPHTMIACIRNSCKHRSKDLTCDVTVDDLQELWDSSGGVCAYSGLPLEIGVNASIDRVDSSKNYTKENIQFVHKDINRMKSDFTEEYFLELCTSIVKQRGL